MGKLAGKGTGRYISAGHGCWGILMSPASGEAMASLIATGSSSNLDISQFSPNRFGDRLHIWCNGSLHLWWTIPNALHRPMRSAKSAINHYPLLRGNPSNFYESMIMTATDLVHVSFMHGHHFFICLQHVSPPKLEEASRAPIIGSSLSLRLSIFAGYSMVAVRN